MAVVAESFVPTIATEELAISIFISEKIILQRHCHLLKLKEHVLFASFLRRQEMMIVNFFQLEVPAVTLNICIEGERLNS